MSWQERLKTGAYVSPSGERIEFLYEDVSRSFDKKTSAYDFPDASGTFVLDMGTTGRKYPIQAFFAGDDCDILADAFEDALAETGRGRLEHPIYGTVDVVPFGTVTRNDALKTAANQSMVEVTFWETIPLIYPIPQTDPTSEVLDSVKELAGATAEEVAGGVDIFSAEAIVGFKTKVSALLSGVRSVIGRVMEIKAQVLGKVAEVTALIDSIVTATVETAQEIRDTIVNVVTTIQDIAALPSQIIGGIKEKITEYKEMLSAVMEPLFPDDSESDFYGSETFVNTLVGGMIVSIVESEFNTQGDALEAAEDVLEILETVTDWAENTATSVGIVDTGTSYKQLQNSAALTAGYLVEMSFSLKKERKVILTHARSIIDLAAELYGKVDDVLDFFITSNDFSGSEILEIPKGREVLYYVG